MTRGTLVGYDGTAVYEPPTYVPPVDPCCWTDTGAVDVGLGPTSAYVWTDSPLSNADFVVTPSRWQLNLGASTFPAGFSRSAQSSATVLPLDPQQVQIDIPFGIDLPEPTNADGRVSAGLTVAIDRVGPSVTEHYSVAVTMFKNTGAFDWESHLTITTPTGSTDFSMPGGYGKLFVSTTLSIAISSSGITASAGGITGSRSYAGNTTQTSSLVKTGLTLSGSVENGNVSASPPWPPTNQCDVWALVPRITSPLGNCVSVPRNGVDCGPSAPAGGVGTPVPGGYSFFDDFTGPGLDGSKWGYGPTGHFHVPQSETSILYDPENIVVSGGNLGLSARRQPDGTWHGALVDTQTKFSQLYGWFGVRAKMVQGKGLFPAPLWLYGSGQEIDVCEILSNQPGTNSKGYSPYPYADVTLAHFHLGRTPPLTGYRYHLPSGTFADGFHTFEIEWRASYVAWYVDGVERARCTDPAIIPNVAMSLVVDHAAGGAWASSPDGSTPSPATILIDKVWAKP